MRTAGASAVPPPPPRDAAAPRKIKGGASPVNPVPLGHVTIGTHGRGVAGFLLVIYACVLRVRWMAKGIRTRFRSASGAKRQSVVQTVDQASSPFDRRRWPSLWSSRRMLDIGRNRYQCGPKRSKILRLRRINLIRGEGKRIKAKTCL